MILAPVTVYQSKNVKTDHGRSQNEIIRSRLNISFYFAPRDFLILCIKKSAPALLIMDFIISREAIAAIIGDIVFFYNSKNLNCIGGAVYF